MTKNELSRRGFLKAGGVLSLLVVGGAVFRLEDQGVFSVGEGPAYAPWHSLGLSGATSPINLVRAAVLAANAHNTQPWLFHVTEREISVYADTSRNIGAMDSLHREMYISLGCAIENMCIAAAPCGCSINIELMPDPANSAFVAHALLTPEASRPSELYGAIPRRHTDRSGFNRLRPVTEETLDKLSTEVTSPNTQLTWYAAPNERRRVGLQTVDATLAIVNDKAMSRSSSHWYRSNWSDIQKYRDGITMDAQGMSPFITVLGKMAPALSESQADSIWLQNTRDIQTATAGAYGVISISDFSRKEQLLEAGRLWQRLHLAATLSGMAMQPLNQIVERADREIQLTLSPQFGNVLQEFAGAKPRRGVFIFRIGYPVQMPLPSPRRSAEQVLI
jgi:hypothetical protein